MLLYILLSLISTNAKYIDVGDGNYLYISWRMSQGEILYKEVPSPQPPMLLLLGQVLLFLSGGDQWLVRFAQIIIHALTACCVWAIAFRIFRWHSLSALAGTIYLFLPLGLWWSTGYQSEPLLNLFLAINNLLLLDAILKERPSWSIYGSAFFAVLGCFTNMTSTVYVGLQFLFIAFQYRWLLKHYSLMLFGFGGLFLIVMYFYSQGEYFLHVFTRQVGTYPTESLEAAVSYFLGKLNQEGGDVLYWQGGFVVCAIAGVLLFIGSPQRYPARDYVTWWAIFSLGSIIFVTKGGTVDYIFTLADRWLHLLRFFLLTLFMATAVPSMGDERTRAIVRFGKWTLVACLFLPVLLLKPLCLIIRFYQPLLFELCRTGVESGALHPQPGLSGADRSQSCLLRLLRQTQDTAQRLRDVHPRTCVF